MGKGSNTTTTTTEQTYDPVASAAMSDIAERQQIMAEDAWEVYKDYFQDYEIAAAEANSALLPYLTQLSQEEIQERLRQLPQKQALTDALNKLGVAATEEQIRNIPLDRPLNDALREAGIAVTREQLRDLELDRPLRDLIRKEQMRDLELDRPLRDALRQANILATEEQIRNIPLDRPLNDALRDAGIAFTKEQMRDLELNRPLKDAIREAQIKDIERREKELEMADPAVKKFYEESVKGVDLGQRADEAGANVVSAMRSERGSRGREMSRYGIDPGSSRFKDELSKTGINAAGMIAAARNKATVEGEKENYGRLATVMGVRPGAVNVPGGGMTTPTPVPGTPKMTEPEGPGRVGITGSASQVGAKTPGALPLPNAPSGSNVQTYFGSADPYARASGNYQAAAGTYAPLASRVLSSTGTKTEPKTSFFDFAGNVLGQAAGAYTGGVGLQAAKKYPIF